MKKLPIDSDQTISPPKDSDNFFLSPHHQQLYQKLITGFCEGKILFTLTGESGLGKTFLMEHIARGLGVSTQLIKIQRSNTSYDEFFDSIGKESGIDLSNESTLAEKVACLTRCFRAQSERHIIIEIDHAQKIKPDTLGTIFNWVKLISSEQDHSSYIHIVLIGLPALDDQLKKSGLHKLDSDITCQYNLKPLNDDEILDYINFHLNQSEDSAIQFEQDALERIAFYAKGNPGLINKLCDLGLLTASLDQNPTVTSADIDEVADNCMLAKSKITLPEHSPSSLDIPQLKTDKPTPTKKNPETLLTQLLSGKNPLPLLNEDEVENEPVAHSPKNDDVTVLTNTSKHAPTLSAPVTILRAEADRKFPSEPESLSNLSEPVTIRRDEFEESIPNKPERISTQSKTITTQRYQQNKTNPDKPDKFSSTDESTKPRKSFINGLLIGLMFSIAGLLAMNLNWLFKQDKDSSQLKTEAKLEQPKQTIRIAKRTATTNSAVQDQDLDNLNQPVQDSSSMPAEKTGTVIHKITDSTDTKDIQITEAQTIQPTITETAKAGDLHSRRISKLFDQADQQLVKKQLMTPVEDSAWQTYQDILTLEPDNELALAGIEKITKTYVIWAREEIKKDNPEHAEYLFNRALEVSPGNKDALSGLRSLGKKPRVLDQTPSAISGQSFEKQQAPTTDLFELLNRAELQLEKKQLMMPVDDNAWNTYQQILDLDPGNIQALAGINKIGKTYILWAWQDIKKGNFQKAKYHFNKALEVSPGDVDALSGLDWLAKNNGET